MRVRTALAALCGLLGTCAVAGSEDSKPPLKELSSAQKASAREAILGEGKKYEAAIAKVREVGPLSKGAAEEFLKKLRFQHPAQKAGLRKVAVATRAGERSYTLSVPGGYSPARAWPLVISLHGAGGDGDGEYGWMWAGESKRWNGLIACPSGQPPGAQWFPEQEEFILAVYRDLTANFNVDANRVYIHGFSNGGNGAWYYAMSHPWLFAAACPRGGGNPDPSRLENLMHLGTYVIHGELDGTIPCASDRASAAKLKDLGYDVVYVEIPGGSHEPFQKETPKVLEYFQKHVRNPWVKKFVYASPDSRSVRAYWVEVTKASGTHRIEAEVLDGNRVSVRSRGADELVLHLSDALLDLDKPVIVSWNDSEAHNALVPRTLEAIVLDLRDDRDPGRACCARLRLGGK